MHELSIALSIVNIAEETVREAAARKVDRIELEIGTLSGVELRALDFAWEPAVRNSVLEGAERTIHEIGATAVCLDCGHEYRMEQLYDACPACQSYFRDLKTGKELRVKSMIIS